MANVNARRARPKIMAPRKHGPEFSQDKTWAELSKNIREIQNQNASKLSFEENHRFAYNMVLHKQGDMLYRGVKQLVIENLDELARRNVVPAFPTGSVLLQAEVQSREEEALLKALWHVWDEHTNNMIRLGQILRYMDRVHTKSANVPPTSSLSLELFRKHIMKPPIKEHVVKAVLNQVRHERDGYVVNRSAIKQCVDVFLSLEDDVTGTTSLYKCDLEPDLLKQSKEFYRLKGEELLDSSNASEFLRSVEARFDAEDQRTHHYLSSQTSSPLRQILKDQLLTPHLPSVISQENSGLDVMIDLGKLDDLSRLYRLSIIIPTGVKCLTTALKASVARRGTIINENSSSEDNVDVEADEEGLSKRKETGKAKPRGSSLGVQVAVKWVQDVLSLKDKFDAIWKDAFQSSREVETALIEAFGKFVNQNRKSAEFISLFIDDQLKRGLKGKTDFEVDDILDKTIRIFRFISEKDVFERYYKGHLAKRLLHAKSVNDDAERGMLAKFKVECGVQFTRKMEGMFQDMKISQDTTNEYHDHMAKTTAPEIELLVTVMTSNCWPMTHSDSPCDLPPVMAKACKSFDQFYLTKHSGRKLSWQLSLGNADVKVRFASKTHELNVSTFALVILLLFEDLSDTEFLTYNEIQKATSISEADLKRHLQSLACAKFKILKKHPPGRDIYADDSFTFNNDFSAPMQKIKIGTISSKLESTEERKETLDRIEEERKHQIEACIVRIMKNRKHMAHNDLIHEAAQQLTGKFRPDPTTIKKRIEGLIEREYLERCEDRRSYNYLA